MRSREVVWWVGSLFFAFGFVIGSARVDVVLTAPEAGVSLLFIEADNCTEDAVPHRREVRQVRPVLQAEGEGHRRYREVDEDALEVVSDVTSRPR